jgi:hypothetical protein
LAPVSNWGRWSDDGRRGTLNHLTRARIAGALRLARTGETVSLSQPLRTEAGIDMPEPADHHMTMLTDVDIGSGSVRFAKDYVGVDYHNEGHSHIDAFSHVAFDGLLFDGKPDRSVTSEGASAGDIEVLRDGLVGRAVLLDTEGVAFPIHVLAINAMGVHLLDYLQFEDVAARCETEGRWDFLFVAAPLRIVGGTGSPLNPLAIF